MTEPETYRSSLDRAKGRPWPIRLLAALGSVKMAATLIALVLAVVVAATWYERDFGRHAAGIFIYEAPWFGLIFIVMAGCVAAAALMRWPWKRQHIGFVTVHAGLITVIIGFLLSPGRLDGSLVCVPGKEAHLIELPFDRLDLVAGEAREGVVIDPVVFAGPPSLPRYLLWPVWPLRPAGIAQVDLPLFSAGGIDVRCTAVALTAEPVLGFVPAPSGGAGSQAVRVRILAATPTAPGDAEAVEDRWLTATGDKSHIQVGGLLDLSLGTTASQALAEDFAKPDGGTAGRLLVYRDGQRFVVDLAAVAAGKEFTLADDLAVRWSRVVLRPRIERTLGSLLEDPEAPLLPILEMEIGRGPAEQRTWRRHATAAWLVQEAAMAGECEFLFEHPELLKGGGKQGMLAQVLIGPGNRLTTRWLSRSKGFLGSSHLTGERPQETALIDLVGNTGGPMRLTLEETWIPHAEPAPMAVQMVPDAADRAQRWLRVEARRGDQRASAWLARGPHASERTTLRLGDSEALISYRSAQYDLRQKHGFSIRLDEFMAGTDPGGSQKASFRSDVTVVPNTGPTRSTTISMNEPLEVAGVSLYQTSYQPELDDQGRPTGRFISVLTAATDPGRGAKYVGSALVVLGTILIFWFRPRRKE